MRPRSGTMEKLFGKNKEIKAIRGNMDKFTSVARLSIELDSSLKEL